MSIISLAFLVFLGITLIVYYVVPGRIQWWILLAASVVFYLYVGVQYIIYITASVIISFFAAQFISLLNEKQRMESAEMDKTEQYKARMKQKCRRMLVPAVIAVISFLAFLKYYNFVIENLNAVLSVLQVQKIKSLNLVLPLGISFYTFQIIAYLVDVYRGKCKAQRNFAKYALFVFFFPQITEGPIARYDQLAPQLYAQRKVSYDNLRYGAQLMIWGFFKKIVIADRLALFVNTVYGNDAKYSGPVFILATVFFSIQMYADFSGCMDIVTGAAEMFGIKLMKNFNHPYFSKTIPEFWRRWHISLSSWFKDYVFYPVSSSKLSLKINKNARNVFGNTAGRIISSCFPILVVWMLTGLWHGAQWNYVVWGLSHGIFIILGIIFAPFIQKINVLLHIKTLSFGWRVFQMIRTFLICTAVRVFFRANGLFDAFDIFAKMFGRSKVPGGFFSQGMDPADFVVAIIAMLILLTVSILQERMSIRETLGKKNIVFRWTFYFAAVFAVVIFGVYGSSNTGSNFIYEKF